MLDIATPLTMVIAETTGTDTLFYLHGLGLVAQSAGVSSEYFTKDALGSVRQVINGAGGLLLARTYDPYGMVYASAGVNATSFGYTGEMEDSNSLLFLRARYYAPSMGRFLNMDPSRQEVNPYQYSYSNPLYYTDPSGLCTDRTAENYDGKPDTETRCRYSRGGVIYTDLWGSDYYGGCQKCHASNAVYQATGRFIPTNQQLTAYDTHLRRTGASGFALGIGGVACTAAADKIITACLLFPDRCATIAGRIGEVAYWGSVSYTTQLGIRTLASDYGYLPTPAPWEYDLYTEMMFGLMAGHEIYRAQTTMQAWDDWLDEGLSWNFSYGPGGPIDDLSSFYQFRYIGTKGISPQLKQTAEYAGNTFLFSTGHGYHRLHTAPSGLISDLRTTNLTPITIESAIAKDIVFSQLAGNQIRAASSGQATLRIVSIGNYQIGYRVVQLGPNSYAIGTYFLVP